MARSDAAPASGSGPSGLLDGWMACMVLPGVLGIRVCPELTARQHGSCRRLCNAEPRSEASGDRSVEHQKYSATEQAHDQKSSSVSPHVERHLDFSHCFIEGDS